MFPFLFENENENENENEKKSENNLIDSYMSIIHQLINPYVHILYVTSTNITSEEILRHIHNLEKLGNLNVFDIRRRFCFLNATKKDFFPISKINSSSTSTSSSSSSSTSIVYSKGRVQESINYYLSIFPTVTFLPIYLCEKEMKLFQLFKLPYSVNNSADLEDFHSKSFMKKVK